MTRESRADTTDIYNPAALKVRRGEGRVGCPCLWVEGAAPWLSGRCLQGLCCIAGGSLPPFSNAAHLYSFLNQFCYLLVCSCVPACGDQKWMEGKQGPPRVALHLISYDTVSLNPHLEDSARRDTKPRTPHLCLPRLTSGFSRECWGLNSNPGLYNSALVTEPNVASFLAPL